MRIKKFFEKALVSLFLVCSCGGLSDVLIDLGGNYYYLGEGTPNNYIYFSNDKRSKGIGPAIETIIIYPNVENYSYDKRFILVLQKPSHYGSAILYSSDVSSVVRAFKEVDSLTFDKVPKVYQKKYLENLKDSVFYKKVVSEISFKNTIEDQHLLREIADSIIRSDSEFKKVFAKEFNYWIIEKEAKRVFGPFTYKEFLDKKNDLGVSEDLKLKQKH